MRVIKVIYNSECKDVLELLKKVPRIIIEKYDYGHYKERKNAVPIMTRHGAKQLPFLVFEDENNQEYAAYWPESKKELTLELIDEFLDIWKE